MMEQLESRTLFSADPHSALTTLRVDVGTIGRRINVLIVANKAAVANLQSDVSIFPTHLTSDKADLQVLNVRFRAQVAILSDDYNNAKVLLGRDITQLINDANAYNRHPTAATGQAFQASEQLLTAQGIASSTNLSQAVTQMQKTYDQALALFPAAHPADSTLTTRVSHIKSDFATNIQAIQILGNTIAGTDIPNFITALEPNGVVTA